MLLAQYYHIVTWSQSNVPNATKAQSITKALSIAKINTPKNKVPKKGFRH